MIDRVEIYEKEHPGFITITCRGGFRLAKKNFDAAGVPSPFAFVGVLHQQKIAEKTK